MSFKLFLEAWKQARHDYKKRKAEIQDAEERAQIAKIFNDRYTYRMVWKKDMPDIGGERGVFGLKTDGGYAWMCPECNQIHFPQDISGVSGLQYPRCCQTAQGHRHYENIRTK